MLAADPQTIVGLWSVGALPRTAAHKRRKYDIKRLSDITEWSEGELLSIAGRRRAGGRASKTRWRGIRSNCIPFETQP